MWFKKDRTPKEPREKRSKVPEGLWVKCDSCREILYNKELARNFKICTKCGYHFRLSAPERLRMLFDDEKYVELESDLKSVDPLRFRDSKRYRDRLKQTDIRLGKNFRFGANKALVALDIFNLFNSNTPDVYQQGYGPTYLNPLSITVGRFFKVSAQLDF